MLESATDAFSFADWGIDLDNESEESREWWSVVVRPPEESDNEPREVAERLFTILHGHGRIAFEVHSNGADVELQLVAGDRSTAEMVARTCRAEIGAQADVMPASVPIDETEPLAGARFRYKRDAVYPVTTTRTDESAVGPLHHIFDTMAAEDLRGTYQLVAEPVEGDWTARRSRGLPQSIESERDLEVEGRRAVAAMLPVIGVSLLLSPWPFETAMVVSLGLVVAATVGEGVRLPERRTATDIARETRERAKDAYGARSSQAKRAKETAEVVAEQDGAPGWRFSVRLVVAGENQLASGDYRDRLVTQLERSVSSSVTGQELVPSKVAGEEARETLEAVRERRIDRPPAGEYVHRLLAHGTRREMYAASMEMASFAYFPDREGGGSDARSFSSATETSKTLPEGVPSYSRPESIESPAYQLDPDDVVTRRHSEFGEVAVKAVEGNEVYAGGFVRELAESRTVDGNVYLGYVEDGGAVQEIGLESDQLPQHMFITGASGAGKTTLAEYLALQHAHAGRGFAIIDPHNDLVDDVKRKLPEDRIEDVISVNPQDTESDRTVTINFLDVDVDRDDSDFEEAVNASVADIVSVLGQGANAMGDRMKPYIRAVSRGMIVSEETYTLVDMREFFIDDEERKAFARQMRSEGRDHIADVADEIAEMSRDDLSPITRLLQKWVLSPVSRQIIENEESSFSFREAIDNDRIILVRNNLADDDLQRLVATSIYRKIMRAAVSRPKGERDTYPLIIDEADDIQTPEMSLGDDLGNARKWGVSLCLMTQLPSRLKSIKKELMTNCKTFVAYACPDPDEARTIASMFDCAQAAIGKLGNFYSQVQVDVGGERAGPFKTASPAPMPPVRSEKEVEEMIDKPSRERFGVERADVEIVEDGSDSQTPVDEFLHAAVEAVEADVIEQGKQYTHVHAGTDRERLRINPKRTIEAIESSDRVELDVDLDTVRKHAREHVDDDDSSVSSYRQNTPPVGRCIGFDLSQVHTLDTGQLSAQ